MRLVCPKDVKKMLVQTARSVYWKKWAAKHEYEELLALFRKKVRENWTENHRNVARKIFWKVAGNKRDCSILIGRTPVNVKPSKKRKGKKSTGLPRMVRSQTRDSRSFQEVGAKSKNLKEGMEVAKRYCNASTR